MKAAVRVAAALASALALLFLVLFAGPARAADPVPARSASPKPPLQGKLVLGPGRIEVHMGDEVWAVIPSPKRLDLVDLVKLVKDQKLVSRLPDGRVELWVPIQQLPGSRLAITGDTVPELRLMAGSRLYGSDALLSTHGADLTASGDTGPGPAQPLLSYDKDSGVRMSRLQITDSRTGKGAGQVVSITDGSQLDLLSTVITGGRGGIVLDDASPVSLNGVQVAHTHGTGVTASGSTDLTVGALTVRSNAADGLSLHGTGLTVQVDGQITAAGNRGQAVRLTGTGKLDPSSLHVVTGKRPPHRAASVRPAVQHPAAGVPLTWLVAAGLLLLAAAVSLELVRQRRDPHIVVTAPEHVLNRR